MTPNQKKRIATVASVLRSIGKPTKKVAGGGAGVVFAFKDSRWPDATAHKSLYIPSVRGVDISVADLVSAFKSKSGISIPGSWDVENLNVCSYYDTQTARDGGKITHLEMDADSVADFLASVIYSQNRDGWDSNTYAYVTRHLDELLESGDDIYQFGFEGVQHNPIYSAGWVRADLDPNDTIELSVYISNEFGPEQLGGTASLVVSDDLADAYDMLDSTDDEYSEDEDA